MARPLRVDLPGARHHVMNRGAQRRPIFQDHADRAHFLALLSQLPARFGVQLHGYALMGNHYHLMLRPLEANLAPTMKWLGQVWTQRANARLQTDGPLFRGRYHSVLVDSDVHWGHLGAYLALNPVDAGLAPSADLARFTSHRALTGAAPCPPWLCTRELLDWHGGPDRYRAYVDAVHRGDRTAPDGFEAVLGARSWTTTATTPVRRGEVHLDRAVAERQIFQITGLPWFAASDTQGCPDTHGVFAAWVLHRLARVPLKELGRAWGISGQAVGRRVKRFDSLRHRDRDLWSWTAELEQRNTTLAEMRLAG